MLWFTSVPGKINEKIVLWVVEKHLKDNTVFGHSQHGFRVGKSCLNNSISFYGKVTHVTDYLVDVIFLDFSTVFDIVSNSILLDKIPTIQLWQIQDTMGEQLADGSTQMVIVNSYISLATSH